MADLTHLNEKGEAHMVDISSKSETFRSATAETFVHLDANTTKQLLEGNNKKGDVFATARIAGIQAAKRCSYLIPLCHPLPLTKIIINLDLDQKDNRLRVESTCKTKGSTGVEMEALTAASIAALTVYDMCKAVDKGIIIGPTRLLEKTGGKSGEWVAHDPPSDSTNPQTHPEQS